MAPPLFAASMVSGNELAIVLVGVLVGGILALVGLLIARGGVDAIGADLERPLTPLGEARPGAVVRVRGRAAPGRRGPDASPLSGRPAVYYSIHASFAGNSGGDRAIERLLRGFYVVVGDVYVHLDPEAATFYGTETWWVAGKGVTPTPGVIVHPARPEQIAWLSERAGSGWNVDGGREVCVSPGDEIDVVGTVQAMPAGSPEGALTFGRPPEGFVRVMVGSIDDLAQKVKLQRRIGFTFIAFGALVGVGAIALASFG